MRNHGKFIALALLLIGITFTLAFARPVFVSANAASPLVTPMPSPPVDQAAPNGPPLSLTLSMLCFCLVLLLIIGVFVLGIVARRQGSTDDKL